MATTESGTHHLPDGTELYTKSWIPAEAPTAVLIFIHGFSDHLERYAEFFPRLSNHNILVHAFDQRGWGRSVKKPSDRGLTGPTSTVLADITSFISAHLPSPAPLFLMGHSMGGAEVLQYAARGPEEMRKHILGYLAEAPFIALHPAAQPSRFTVVAGRLAGRLLPRRQMVSKLEAKNMCRDESVWKSWEEDELCHDTGTLEGLSGMLDRAEELDTGRVSIEDTEGCRLWLGHGGSDLVTSHEATIRFMGRCKVKDKTLKVYDGCFHCGTYSEDPILDDLMLTMAKVHAEPGEDKIRFATDVVDWIKARSKSEDGTSGEESDPRSKL